MKQIIRSIGRLSPIVAACVVAGCSTRPLPEDVQRLDTTAIVHRIRCETRDAITRNVAKILKTYDSDIENLINQNEGKINLALRNKISDKSKEIYDKFSTAAFSYDFSFNIYISNDISGLINLASPLPLPTLNIGLSSSANRLRRNLRNFRVTDSADEIVNKMTTECIRDSNQSSEFIYPITGTIGMEELINSFYQLVQQNGLDGTKDDEDVPAISDTITFTTTLTGGVSPLLAINPVGRSLQVASASLNATTTRSDTHSVIISIALPPPPKRTSAPIPRQQLRALIDRAKDAARYQIDYQIYRANPNANPIFLGQPPSQ